MSFLRKLNSALSGRTRYNAILIDDDQLIRTLWTHEAERLGKSIRCYENPSQFFDEMDQIDPSSPVYVDVVLGNQLCGIRVSEEVAFRGFKNVYLATGKDASDVGSVPWVKGVMGKMPPWGEPGGQQE